MPPAPKSNWNYLYDVYQKLCETEPDTGISEFARAHGADEGACRAAFNRIKKKRSVRTKLTKRTETGRTDGQEISKIFEDVLPEEANEIIRQISDPRLVGCHAKLLTMLFRSFARLDYVHQKQCALNEDGTEKIKIETIRDVKDEYQSQREFIYVLREIVPFILEITERTGMEMIITNLQDRKYDVTQAALEIAKLGVNLPEAIKIMLSKTPAIMIAQNFDVPPDTKTLDQKAFETMQQLEWQYANFLPERRAEVIELKKEMQGAESFGPETDQKNKKKE